MSSVRLYLVHFLFSLLPSTRAFALKRFLLRWAGAVVGNNVRIVSSARFYITGNLVIGENTWLGHELLVVGGGASVTIGDNVDIAPRVLIVTGSHKLFSQPDKAAGDGYSSPVEIGNGAWLGAGSIILGGIKLGNRCMIAAGACVNRDVLANCMVGGVPAKPIKFEINEYSNETIKCHEQI